MEKEVKKIMDRNRRREARAASREARAARREARAARRNQAGVDPVKKSAASSLRQVMNQNKDLTANVADDVTKEGVNKTIGTTVDKVIDKGAKTIGKAFDKGIKQVSDLFDNEKQTAENHSDLALNEETDEEFYVDESVDQTDYTHSSASDSTKGSWFGCIFWIFIGFLFLAIFT